jgi:transposase
VLVTRSARYLPRRSDDTLHHDPIRLRRSQVLGFFSRLPRCVVGLEACATAHYWARELGALGHEVRLMPAQYVKAYVKRNKNDAADAEAICEAVQRPTMRFVPVKTAEQQAAQLLHRGREQLVRQRTMLVNALRAHLAEFGIVAAQGLRNVAQLIAIVRDDGPSRRGRRDIGRSDPAVRRRWCAAR